MWPGTSADRQHTALFREEEMLGHTLPCGLGMAAPPTHGACYFASQVQVTAARTIWKSSLGKWVRGAVMALGAIKTRSASAYGWRIYCHHSPHRRRFWLPVGPSAFPLRLLLQSTLTCSLLGAGSCRRQSHILMLQLAKNWAAATVWPRASVCSKMPDIVRMQITGDLHGPRS